MKAANLIKISAEILKMMSDNDLKVEDYKHIELYRDYRMARQNNEKYNAIIYDLAIRHHLSESTVKRIVRRFDKDI